MQAHFTRENETSGPEEALVFQNSNIHTENLPKINIDELLETEVGSTGLWQWSVCLLIMLSTSSLTTFAVFANSSSSYRCKMEHDVEQFIQTNNITFDHAASIIGPWTSRYQDDDQAGPPISLKGCYRYQLEWSHLNLTHVFFNENRTKLWTNVETEDCPNGYVFQDSPFHYPGNVVSEFETVCTRSWFVPFGTSVYMFGMMLGFIIGGWFGDRFGRKKTIMLFSLIEFVTGIWTTLSTNYTSYIIARAFMAIGSTGKISVCSVLLMEISLARYRSLFTAFLGLGVNFLYRGLMALLAYLIPEWRYLNLAFMSPNVLSILYFWFLPESPRWLLAKNKTVKALMVMQSGFRNNHRFGDLKQSQRINELIECYSTKEQQQQQELEQKRKSLKPTTIEPFEWKTFLRNLSFLKPFSTRQLSVITLLGSSFVFGIVMCFFGLILYARIVRNYVYLVSFLNSLTAIPAVTLFTLLYRYLRNRKRPLMATLILSSLVLGSSSIYTVVAKPRTDIILTLFSNIGMILVNAALLMCYVYVPELFPSEIRTFGFGTILGLARFGSMACTFINELDTIVGHGFPLIIYSVVLMFECIVLYGLRDTSGENLPDLIGQKREDQAGNA